MEQSPTENKDNNLNILKRNFFIFIISVFIILSVSFSIISIFSIKKSLNEVYSKFITKDIDLISKTVNTYLESTTTSLEDISSLPIIVNSVMNPQHDHSFLKDFMNDLKVQGRNSDFWLIDINGKTIQNNNDHMKFPPLPDQWIDDLVDNKNKHLIRLFLNDEQPYIFLAVPVKYNGQPEGVLVSIIKSKLKNLLNVLLESEREYAFLLECDNNTIFLSKHINNKNTIERNIDMPLFNGQIFVEVEKSSINEAIENLIILILIIVIISSLVLLIPIKNLGDKLIVKPQILLESSRLETQKVNQKLTVANDELQQFAYRTSHDLKAPMATIRGLCKFIIQDIKENQLEDAIEGIEKVRNNSKKLEELTSDILHISKIENIDDKGEEIKISEIVNNITEKIELLIEEHNIKIEVNENHNQPFLSQRIRIAQILENLISNSIKYSDSNKNDRYVKIDSYNNEKQFVIKVSDNGIGIPARFHDKLFNMFSRFNQNYSTGSGLGLYIFKKHMDILGGQILFESSEEGSSFTLSFIVD